MFPTMKELTLPEHKQLGSVIRAFLIESKTEAVHANQWLAVVMHLRNLPNMPKAFKANKQCTHHIMIIAIDKEKQTINESNYPLVIHSLTPAEHEIQFICKGGDREAAEILFGLVGTIEKGGFSPANIGRARTTLAFIVDKATNGRGVFCPYVVDFKTTH